MLSPLFTGSAGWWFWHHRWCSVCWLCAEAHGEHTLWSESCSQPPDKQNIQQQQKIKDGTYYIQSPRLFPSVVFEITAVFGWKKQPFYKWNLEKKAVSHISKLSSKQITMLFHDKLTVNKRMRETHHYVLCVWSHPFDPVQSARGYLIKVLPLSAALKELKKKKSILKKMHAAVRHTLFFLLPTCL